MEQHLEAMKAPVLLVSHGAATLTTRAGDPLDLAMRSAATLLVGARAVVVVSAHDVREEITVGVAPRIALEHDHPAARGLAWEAPGALDAAGRLMDELLAHGIPRRLGPPRLDHGAWVPLRALDPAGARPVVTLSLHASFEPELHVEVGRAIAALRREGVAVLASGGLTHNQEEFRLGWFAGGEVAAAVPPSARFEAWAASALATGGAARTEALLAASAHPDFAWCHPSFDHWLPTLVAVGAAEDEDGELLHRGFQHSLATAMIGFGCAPPEQRGAPTRST
jgi:4,5-DOPA dioxygenase extradiol